MPDPGSSVPLRKGASGPLAGSSGEGITPPAGQIDGTAADPLIVGITSEAGAGAELETGVIADGSFLRRVGLQLVGVALAASMVVNDSGVVGASVADALDTLGAAVTGTVPTSRTISTTAPLSGGGDLSANRTLTVASVSNTSSGVVPQTNGTAGQALIATALGTTWSTNFQAQDVQTTGNLLLGSTLPSAGTIRSANGLNFTSITTALVNANVVQFTAGNSAVFGSNNAGSIYNGTTTSLRVSNVDYVVLTGGVVALAVANLRFDNTVAAPQIFQQNTTTNSATGETLVIHATDCTGTTSNGGPILIRPGSGTTAGGQGRLQTGALSNRFRWDDTGLSFFSAATVAQQTITGSRGGNAALADLLTKLALTGLIVDSTSA